MCVALTQSTLIAKTSGPTTYRHTASCMYCLPIESQQPQRPHDPMHVSCRSRADQRVSAPTDRQIAPRIQASGHVPAGLRVHGIAQDQPTHDRGGHAHDPRHDLGEALLHRVVAFLSHCSRSCRWGPVSLAATLGEGCRPRPAKIRPTIRPCGPLGPAPGRWQLRGPPRDRAWRARSCRLARVCRSWPAGGVWHRRCVLPVLGSRLALCIENSGHLHWLPELAGGRGDPFGIQTGRDLRQRDRACRPQLLDDREHGGGTLTRPCPARCGSARRALGALVRRQVCDCGHLRASRRELSRQRGQPAYAR